LIIEVKNAVRKFDLKYFRHLLFSQKSMIAKTKYFSGELQ
jgi:hypothetical protein